MYLMAVRDEGGTSSETLVTKIFYLSYERIALLTQHVAALRSCGRLPRKGFSSNRELLQSFSQLGPVWLRLARKKAPSARRSGVARSKGVLGHRAFAPRPKHEFRMAHISPRRRRVQDGMVASNEDLQRTWKAWHEEAVHLHLLRSRGRRLP